MARFRDALAAAGPRRDRRGQAALALGGRPAPGRRPGRARGRATRARGAAAVSVLVDERFGGTLDDLRAARAATDAAAARQGLLPRRGRALTSCARRAPTPRCCCCATSTTRRARG